MAGDLEGLSAALEEHRAFASEDVLREARALRDRLKERRKRDPAAAAAAAERGKAQPYLTPAQPYPTLPYPKPTLTLPYPIPIQP